MNRHKKKTIKWPYLVVVIFLVFTLFPVYWMLITSLKTDDELYSREGFPLWINKGITFEHFTYLFDKTLFFSWLTNSFFVASLVTCISLCICIPAAYAITRLRFKGSGLAAIGIFVCYLIPPTILFIPLAVVISNIGLSNTIWSLIVTYPTFTVPFCTWLLMSYFKSIPLSLEESALVDGATRGQAITKIVLPLASPGIATVFLFAFTLSWSQYIYPLAFISDGQKQVVSVGISTLIRGDIYYWGSLMAAALIGSVPIVLFYSFFSKYFIEGLTQGSMKY